jgi:AbrB family looped-hinge helix DNA binding protein
MVASGTVVSGTQVVSIAPSFYAKVGDDYRIYIPKVFRETMGICEGDIIHVIVGTIIRSRSLYIPGEQA